MIPLLALQEGVKGGLREYIIKVMEVVQYSNARVQMLLGP